MVSSPGPEPASAEWLALLPDGPTKRQFIIDCTGCHQFDSRMARRLGRTRTHSEWASAIDRMLGFAGPASGFPVISAAQRPESTAAWLTASLAGGVPEMRNATPHPGITEYLFPAAQDLPHDLAIDSAGQIIVTGMFSGAMYLLDPASGHFSTVEIPIPNANPRAVEVDAEGRWWVVLGGPQQVARYGGGRWEFFDVGMYAHSVALDSGGGVWVNGHFTRAPELIASVDAAGTIRKVPLPAHPGMSQVPGGPIPYELRTAPNGAVWMSELQGNRMIRYDPSARTSTIFELPTAASGPRRFDIGPDGIVWIPGYGSGRLVRLDPASGKFTEVALPVRDAAPYIARVDPVDGGIWIGTGAADALFRYEPGSGAFEVFDLPTRGALVRHLAVDPRNRDVWLAYGESPGKASARVARLRR